jgi:triacylglycerol esterase/lipase EstA (alpha/beta hydrolase family)
MWSAIAFWAASLGGAAAYLQWAQQGVARGNPAWAYVIGAPLAYAAVVFAFTLIYFALSWWFRTPRPPEARIGVRGTLALVWHEFVALAGAAPRMMVYRWLLRDPLPAPARLPVLLIHGVLCNAGVWNRLARYLAARGIGPVYTISLTPPLASIELFARQTAEKIDAVLAATGARQVVLVSHSMGGLVARAYVRRCGGAKVRRLVTLGTPHGGSVFAWLFPGESLAQLRPNNPWLRELPPVAADLPPIVSLWSWHDSMVAPQQSAVLAGAENVAFVGIGHNALLGDPAIFARVAEEIGRAGATS